MDAGPIVAGVALTNAFFGSAAVSFILLRGTLTRSAIAKAILIVAKSVSSSSASWIGLRAWGLPSSSKTATTFSYI